MKKLIDTQCFIDCEDIPENTATFNLNTLVFLQKKTSEFPTWSRKGVHANLHSATFEKCIRQKC